jgi:glutamate synthase (NADPH/NADH) small chain
LTKKFEGANGRVTKVHCVKVDFSMKEVAGSEFIIEADIVILAIGFLHPEYSGLVKNLGLELDARGNIKTDEKFMSSVKKVFAAGDMHRGQSLVVWAISEGRRAAHFMDEFLMGKSSLPII